MIRVFDAFSGIGGFRSAFERVGGFKTVGWCEIDRFAQKSYRALFDTGGEQFYENIRDIDTAGLADFDLLVGGFPCQPFSVAGKRLGTADERGDLFFELARILEAKRPRYFIFENVPGLLGIEKGQTFKIILETLSELGYCVEWLVHDSAGFGVPQSRKRVYLAGCLGVDCSGKILAFGNCDEENSRKVKQLIGGSQGQRVYAPDGFAVTQCSGSGGMGGKTGLYLIDMNYPPTLTEKARCITARQDSGVSKHKGEHSAVFCDLNENPQITENARCLHTRYDLGVSSGKHKGERSGVLIEDVPRAILNPFKEEVYQNGRRVKEPNEPMFTLTVVDSHGIVHQGRIRRLMPIECWRLQGFTTEQFRKVEATGLSDAQLYKQKKIDLILTKSISRFARNTVDCLEYVRILKELGIGVIFEKENINTLTMTSEFMIALYGSFAQAESESISKNVSLGVQMAMREGKVRYSYKRWLGYCKGEDGKPVIIPEEAEMIRKVYELFLDGHSMAAVAEMMMVHPTDKIEWHRETIRRILTNEKYTGDCLLQKTFTADCITHKAVKNNGERAMYLVSDCHSAIIDRDTFNLVQQELARRTSKRKVSNKTVTEQGKYSSKYALTDLMICGECGTPYRRVVWRQHGTKNPVSVRIPC